MTLSIPKYTPFARSAVAFAPSQDRARALEVDVSALPSGKKLSTDELKMLIPSLVDDAACAAIRRSRGGEELDATLETLRKPSAWGRGVRQTRADGSVVRYFTLKEEGRAVREAEPVLKIVTDKEDKRVVSASFGDVREPSDFIFFVDPNSDPICAVVTLASLFKKSKVVDDQGVSSAYVPDGFEELAASSFDIGDLSVDAARQHLLAAGFREEPRLASAGLSHDQDDEDMD
jgi:hypothetical protein